FEPPPAPPVESPAAPQPQQILSHSTVSAVESAFNTLANTVLSNNARTLEDLVKEMLRPMLKSWLDDNLPGLVERIVKAEIERVSRRRYLSAYSAKVDIGFAIGIRARYQTWPIAGPDSAITSGFIFSFRRACRVDLARSGGFLALIRIPDCI